MKKRIITEVKVTTLFAAMLTIIIVLATVASGFIACRSIGAIIDKAVKAVQTGIGLAFLGYMVVAIRVLIQLVVSYIRYERSMKVRNI